MRSSLDEIPSGIKLGRCPELARGLGQADDFADAQAIASLAGAAAFAFDPRQEILKLDVMLDGDVGDANLDGVQTLGDADDPGVGADGGEAESDCFI